MTAASPTFFDTLEAAARQAETAEEQYRREAAQRIAALERERAFAFRRLNLMRAVADAVVQAEDEEIAVARVLAMLRDRLGWASDSEVRARVLSQFSRVGQAVFRDLVAPDDAPAISVERALAEFEAWYAGSHPTPFWGLFENYIPETPRVDF